MNMISDVAHWILWQEQLNQALLLEVMMETLRWIH